MNVHEMIKQARDNWEVDRLYKDLMYNAGLKCDNQNKEYQYLCGLLCFYQPDTIAKMLHRSPGAVRQDLTKGLYVYIKNLIKETTNQEFKIKWSDIPFKFEELGYKKSLAAPPTPPETKVGWRMWIDIDNIDDIQLDVIVKQLRQLIGDGLKVVRIEKGSIVLFLESTQAGYEQIEALFRDARLAELLGVPVLDVRLMSAIPSANPNTLVNLNQWLQGNFAEAVQAGWQMVEEILQPRQLAFMRADVIKRALSINFGERDTVALVVQITRTTDEEVDILVLVYPTGENINYLPENLKLTVSLAGETEEIQAGSEVNLLRQEITTLVTGEQFSVQLGLESNSVTVDFTI